MSYFSVDAAFWTDPDVIDDFTPEDKYFYLYLLTSPHANISGCYELSIKQAANELGYSKDTVEHLIDRFMNVHKVIDYNKENKEILIHKWGKHHWTSSDKYLVALKKKVALIKTEKFKKYLEFVISRFEDGYDIDMVWIPYQYGTDTTFLSFPFNSILSLDNKEEGVIGGEEEGGEEEEEEEIVEEVKQKPEKPKSEKIPEVFHKYGEYGWVKLTDKQYEKLLKDLGELELLRCIKYVDESAQGNSNKNKWTDWNLVVRRCSRERWGRNNSEYRKRSLTFMDVGR